MFSSFAHVLFLCLIVYSLIIYHSVNFVKSIFGDFL
nr:MAG TPA: hypothetical protein [Caudoviricetes sp.]